MTRVELSQLRADLESQITQRRGLGGYGQDAEAILYLYEIVHKLAEHAAQLDRELYAVSRKITKGAAKK